MFMKLLLSDIFNFTFFVAIHQLKIIVENQNVHQIVSLPFSQCGKNSKHSGIFGFIYSCSKSLRFYLVLLASQKW